MPDITSKYFEAALLDQRVAGEFRGKTYAYVALCAEGGHQLGIAVANEQGYNPISKIFKDEKVAREWADGLNEHIGVDEDTAMRIVISTMGGQRFFKKVA